ncbi:MAG: DUF1653 domain-containing protein [Oscillibacter sp.]|jgi:CYTH domain-containing protein|nr:DUF1653 domain-containing protein [Oscillibacter sp.]
MEIERKFLVRQLPPDLEQYPRQRLEQAYLSRSPVIRVRRMDAQHVLTVKGKGFLQREEHELQLSEAEYQQLLARAEGRRIVKDRYRIPCGSYVIELDVFAPPFAPLVLAEVEFSTEEDALSFCPPDWFGAEVTYDPAYTNAALSGREEEKPDIRPGRYRHYKGNEYEVLEIARHSETEAWMVVYRALYGEGGVWVRPASMWNELVLCDGEPTPRFQALEDR